MELVIEAGEEPGPTGLALISVAHYDEQNGDLMRDPEMFFQLATRNIPELIPFYYRHDYVGVEQWSRNIIRDYYVRVDVLHKQHERFAMTWDNDLRMHNFAEAFNPSSNVRG